MSIIALLLGVINLILLFFLNKKINNNKDEIQKTNSNVEEWSNWLDYYKKQIEKDIKYLTTALNKKFNKNA
jgi:uncharacterized membrane-anchored protein YhcB (DUF1043 family)